MKGFRKAKRFIAVLLTVTLVTQLTPPTLYANPVREEQTQESNREESINQVPDEPEKETMIATVSDGTAEDINQSIPDKWKGMRYAVYTGNNQNMAFITTALPYMAMSIVTVALCITEVNFM